MRMDSAKSQSLLEHAAAHSPVIYYLAEAKRGWPLTYVSENVRDIAGFKPAALLKQKDGLAEHIHPDDRKSARPTLKRLREGGVHSSEYRLLTATGACLRVRETVELKNKGGQDWIVGSLTGLTHEAKTPKDGTGDELVRRVLEACPVSIRMTRLDDGEILYESPSSREAYGGDPDNTSKSVLEHYADPADRQHYVAELKKHGSVKDYVVQFRRANGELYPASVIAKRIEFNGEQVIVSTTRDLTEKRRRENEIRHMQETLEDAIEALSEGFALYDADDRLVICNQRYRDFHCVSSGFLVPGVNWFDLINREARSGFYPDAVGRVDQWISERIREHRQMCAGQEYQQTDGRWVQCAHQFTRQGGIVVTLTDITDRKTREQDLRAARETLEDAIESLLEGFAIWDANDALVMCNSTYKELNMVCADILQPGVKWSDLIRTGAERGQFMNAEGRVDDFVEEWTRTRGRDHTGFEIQHADGRWFVGSSYRTRQGGRAGVRIEITERKEMEETLRESENLVRRVLEASPVPITMNRVDSGEILYESPASKELYAKGKDRRQRGVLGRWADISRRKNYIDALLNTGAIDNWEIERVKHDGSKFWALESARLIEFQGEQVIVSSVLDLTERREKDAEIAQQREALHQSEKLSALGELLAGVSHELNNPLSVLVGQAQLLAETVSDPEIAHRTEKISEAANRCARIVKSFLAMARQEPAQSRPLDINQVVEAALEVTAYALRSADVHVELKLNPDLPHVMVDPDQFGQVVTNLLVNAQHALEEIETARRLTVATRSNANGSSVFLTVSDNGPGIPADLKTRIFEPLFTTKDVGAGTGLGLALCHRIVTTHGGSLGVESEPGEGATFIISLPRTGTKPKSNKRGAVPVPADGSARVLVIDDEPDVATVLAEILQVDGHEVDIAHSGEQALQAIAQTDFDVLLCDLRMPHLDGPGLFRRLEKERPDLRDRMGFLTGDTLGRRAREFLKTAGCPFIEKPVMAEEVRELMSELLSNTNRT